MPKAQQGLASLFTKVKVLYIIPKARQVILVHLTGGKKPKAPLWSRRRLNVKSFKTIKLLLKIRCLRQLPPFRLMVFLAAVKDARFHNRLSVGNEEHKEVQSL